MKATHLALFVLLSAASPMLANAKSSPAAKSRHESFASAPIKPNPVRSMFIRMFSFGHKSH